MIFLKMDAVNDTPNHCLSVLVDLHFLMAEAESPFIKIDVKPICFSINTAWRHARTSVANGEATSLCTVVLTVRVSPF